MQYIIKYDQPGRMRVRYPRFVFDAKDESAIIQKLVSYDFIKSADASYENCGVLVYYKKGYRKQLIKILAKIDFRKLPPAESQVDSGVSRTDREFSFKLFSLITRRVAFKILLPAPIRNIITVIQAVKYIKTGLKTLLEGHIKVELLDATSITVSILGRNYNTASSIMFLLSVSSLLEDYTKARTKAVLTQSLRVKAEKVWHVQDDTEILVSMNEIEPGDIVRVRTGCVIPVDGEVESGEANINEVSMTGESAPAFKTKGASVFAGTVVDEGTIDIKVRRKSSDTKINKIVDLIESSENLKAGVQSKAERLADRIVPFSFLGFGLVWLFTRNITKAIAVLMVDYSCAIKLSTPIAVISAIREASDHDMTVKGGKYLEAFNSADTIVFDKTGTLTNAEPYLHNIIAFEGWSKEEVLKQAACIEEHFPHSVARAIVKGAADRGINHKEEHAEVEYIVAHGIATSLHGERAVIGSRHFVCEDENVEISDEKLEKIKKISGPDSCVYFAVGGKLVGVLCINDPPREEAAKTISELRRSGINNVVMLTGDSEGAAKIISEELGITEYHAQVLPEDKHKYIEKLKADGHTVIMVGDGINDAPALAAADVSVAMADASDIARETADVTLRGASLSELITLRKISNLLMNRIHSNYRFIVTFNTTLIVLGVAGVISPSLSSLLHNTSTMLISANSMTKLLKNKEDKK